MTIRDEIRSTIITNLPNGRIPVTYEHVVERVVDALESRLTAAVVVLQHEGFKKNLSPRMVDEALVHSGLLDSDPEPVEDTRFEALLDAIAEVVDKFRV